MKMSPLLIPSIFASISLNAADIERGGPNHVEEGTSVGVEMVEFDPLGENVGELSQQNFVSVDKIYRYLPARADVRAGREGEIIDAEILWARILCTENCPVITKEIESKLWLLSTGPIKRYVTNWCGVATFSATVITAVVVGSIYYFGALGIEDDCSVGGTNLDGHNLVSVDDFNNFVDCQGDNYNSWGRPNGISNLFIGLLIPGIGGIAYNQFLTRRETKKNEVQDGLSAARRMYQGIAEALLKEWALKVKAIRNDRDAVTAMKTAMVQARSLSPSDLDILYAKTDGALLPRDITFQQIEDVLRNYDAIEAKFVRFLRKDTELAQDILFPLKELGDFLQLENGLYDVNLMTVAFDPEGRIFRSGSHNHYNLIGMVIKNRKLTNEALKSIVHTL